MLACRRRRRDVQESRRLAAQIGVHGGALGARVGEIHRGGSRQPTPLLVLDRMDGRDGRRTDVGLLALGRAEDVHLAALAAATRDMGQSHVVGESVNDATLLRRKGRGKDEGFSRVVVAEEQQLRVELKRLRIIQVYVCKRGPPG